MTFVKIIRSAQIHPKYFAEEGKKECSLHASARGRIFGKTQAETNLLVKIKGKDNEEKKYM